MVYVCLMDTCSYVCTGTVEHTASLDESKNQESLFSIGQLRIRHNIHGMLTSTIIVRDVTSGVHRESHFGVLTTAFYGNVMRF